MASSPLPQNPSLEHIRGQAKALQRAARAGEPEALDLVAEFHPRAASQDGTVPPLDVRRISLTAAQLVVARKYGFASWPRLRAHLSIVETYSRRIDRPDESAEVGRAEPSALVDRFLRLASLGYTEDDPAHRAAGLDLLAAHPDLAGATIHCAASVGNVHAVRNMLAADRSLATVRGGPYDWDALTYLAYSRIPTDLPGRSAVDSARALLDAGADANTGYLWQGLPSPFTALTGAFGGGEQGQPPHPESPALARLLLERGADPNDNQALYNRMFEPANDHLELLFEFGLGSETNGPWHRRLGHALPSPRAMVEEQLRWAADHDLADRVRLLLAHGVDPDGLGYHPVYGSHTAYELAMLGGNLEIAQLLERAGAIVTATDAIDQLLSHILAGDDQARLMIDSSPDVLEAAVRRAPATVARAAQTGRLPAVRLALELGFPVNATVSGQHGQTALHNAAERGFVELAELLVDHGADLTARDRSFDGTPLDWAEHLGRSAVADVLRLRMPAATDS